MIFSLSIDIRFNIAFKNDRVIYIQRVLQLVPFPFEDLNGSIFIIISDKTIAINWIISAFTFYHYRSCNLIVINSILHNNH